MAEDLIRQRIDKDVLDHNLRTKNLQVPANHVSIIRNTIEITIHLAYSRRKIRKQSCPWTKNEKEDFRAAMIDEPFLPHWGRVLGKVETRSERSCKRHWINLKEIEVARAERRLTRVTTVWETTTTRVNEAEAIGNDAAMFQVIADRINALARVNNRRTDLQNATRELTRANAAVNQVHPVD